MTSIFGRRKARSDILEEPLFQNFIIFIFPLMVTNLLQTFYHTIVFATRRVGDGLKKGA